MIGHLFYTTSSFVQHFKSIGDFKLKLQSGNVQFGSKLAILCPSWPWNLMDDLGKQLGTSSILHQALCIISKPWVNWSWSYSPETTKSAINCPAWPWNLMDDLEKQLGTFSMLLQALCIISQPSVNSNWSYSSETPNLGQNRRFFVPCDLEIWRVTLENNRVPLLSNFYCLFTS